MEEQKAARESDVEEHKDGEDGEDAVLLAEVTICKFVLVES